jgi:hypothetical protein
MRPRLTMSDMVGDGSANILGEASGSGVTPLSRASVTDTVAEAEDEDDGSSVLSFLGARLIFLAYADCFIVCAVAPAPDADVVVPSTSPVVPLPVPVPLLVAVAALEWC